jgi:hypothetical protein
MIWGGMPLNKGVSAEEFHGNLTVTKFNILSDIFHELRTPKWTIGVKVVI